MQRIVICMGSVQKSRKVFGVAQGAVNAAKVNCELSYAATPDAVISKLSASPFHYDVLVLDALDENCRKIAAAVRKSNVNASIIFVSDKNIDNILNVIKHRPSGMILVPCTATDIENPIKAALQEQLMLKPWFTVKNKESAYRIPYANILYFESDHRKVILHTDKQIIEFYGKLNDVEALLPSEQFLRCHQSYIINMSRIKKLDKTSRCFTTVTGDVIEISRSCYQQAAQDYEDFMQRN